jgi:hypothetical protein
MLTTAEKMVRRRLIAQVHLDHLLAAEQEQAEIGAERLEARFGAVDAAIEMENEPEEIE